MGTGCFSLFTYRYWAVAILIAAGVLALSRAAADKPNEPQAQLDTPLDVLLGRNGRQRLADELARRTYGGRTHTWDQYAIWGRELVLTSSVQNPPVGAAPSPLLSDHYRCVHCHNCCREDAKLTSQDPEARGKLIEAAKPRDPRKRDGLTPSLTPGTTLWGAVNRQSFYNGHYAKYHRLKVANGQAMNPRALADAVQICCRYCSVGRFPEPWELDSILAYLWELELRLKDLDLPEQTVQQLLSQTKATNPAGVQEARDRLRQAYLQAAEAQPDELPKNSEGNNNLYADGSTAAGDVKRGQWLYASSCAGCHGTAINMFKGAKLVREDARYHEYVLRGTERDDLYMPLFSKQRLSRQQVADIRAYLRSLPNGQR